MTKEQRDILRSAYEVLGQLRDECNSTKHNTTLSAFSDGVVAGRLSAALDAFSGAVCAISTWGEDSESFSIIQPENVQVLDSK